MKKLMCGVAVSLGIAASAATADQIVTVDGEDYFLSHLTANCQSITNDPAAQVACFTALSKLLEEQTVSTPLDTEAVTRTFEALQAVAQYDGDETGLMMTASDCTLRIVYFDNYFHISRRNISSIDLYGAEFDVSGLRYDQTAQVQGAQAPLFEGHMDTGVQAAMWGGAALESSQDNFAPKSPRTTMADYAQEVVDQLPAREGETFDFVLVHPERSQDSAAIWNAFEAFVNACQ